MDKLFEVYVKKIISRDFFQKVYDFLNEIKDDHDILTWKNNRISLFGPSGRDVIFKLEMKYGSKDIINMVHYLILPRNYPLLSNYINSILSDIFVVKFNHFTKGMVTYEWKKLELKLTDIDKFIGDINFSKYDYEIFEDAERFGL